MNARELKSKYIEFFVGKSHAEIPSASLVPENDPTTLFISAGMHPLVPYLLGQPHPLGKRLVNVQKCIRTGDIDSVGDTYHHTFFEMLGNWSLGDYFKNEALNWSFEFITKHLNLDKSRLVVTCFEGDNNSPKDTDSAKIWEKIGIPKDKIKFLPKDDNWWGPAGVTGPCGPDSEMFIDGVEIWNDVFMQFNKDSVGKYQPLAKPNVDTGMGVERTTAFLEGHSDNYLSTIWQLIIKKIEFLSGKSYGTDEQITRAMRIIADHVRSAVFIIADGIEPSNKERGYVLRRLIRRAIRQGKLIGIETNFCSIIAQSVLDNQDNYAGIYSELNQNKEKILQTLEVEENKFRKTLNNGLKEIEKYKNELGKIIEGKPKYIKYSDIGKQAFYFYESFGFPLEMFLEEINGKLLLDPDAIKKSFEEARLEHQEESRTLSAGKFKSGLADHSEVITRYHTATHLLHQSLRQVLGNHVQQSGSNITGDRMRFDFTHTDKLTDDQIKQVNDLVNQQINKKMEVTVKSMPFTDAQKSGALAFFGNKYPEIVTVYQMGDFSAEVCTGPHVKNTQELGKFTIQKQESAGSGKRRIYAILE